MAIRSRLYRLFNPTQPILRPTLMEPEREKLLVDMIEAFSVVANPLSGVEVRCLAEVVGDLDEIPTTGWLESLRKRYPHKIKLRTSRCSHKKTILVNLFQGLMSWALETEKVLAHIAQLAFLIFNIDETRAIPASKARAVLASSTLTQVQYESVLKSSLYTLVGCYGADGSTLFVLYLFKARKCRNGTHADFYAPFLAPVKHTRSHNNVPVYVEVTPGGYMNKAMWKETMDIFLQLAGHRQSVGREKQGILYLDGCSSHAKAETMQLLRENNVSAIYFHPNTSQIVQPADGTIFQNYKRASAKEVQKLEFNASMGVPDQKHYDLAASLEAHRAAVTPDAIRAGFEKRGIFPWDANVIRANAWRACPQDSFAEASEGVQQELLLIDYIDHIKQENSKLKPLERKDIQDVNKAHLLETVAEWKPRPKGRKKASTAPPPKKKRQTKAIPIESEESDMEVDEFEGDDDETDFAVPRLVRSSSAFSCSHCGHQRANGTVPLACLDCSQYWLCSPCRTNTDALATHMKTHEDDEGIGRRKTRNRTNSVPAPL